jgi:hypothetical protein
MVDVLQNTTKNIGHFENPRQYGKAQEIIPTFQPGISAFSLQERTRTYTGIVPCAVLLLTYHMKLTKLSYKQEFLPLLV